MGSRRSGAASNSPWLDLGAARRAAFPRATRWSTVRRSRLQDDANERSDPVGGVAPAPGRPSPSALPARSMVPLLVRPHPLPSPRDIVGSVSPRAAQERSGLVIDTPRMIAEGSAPEV